MRKEIRRIIMFCTILTVGLLLLFFDVTFIQLLLLVFAIAVILPFLLGLVTIGEVRIALDTFKEKLRKISILKKLDEIKIFEKKSSTKPGVQPPKAPAKPEASSQKPEASSQKPASSAKTGDSAGRLPFSSQINSLITTIKTLGTTLKTRTRGGREVADINKMLDKTVNDKVERSVAPPAAAQNSALPAPGGGGSGSAADEDPFLSLSGDEFDAGLLDGLDDDGMTSPDTPGGSPQGPGESMDMGLPEPDLSASTSESSELDSAANDILKAYGADEGLDEFSGLEAGKEDTDADFGDLDNLSLDDVDLEVDLDEGETGEGSTAAVETPADPSTSPAAPVETPSSAVKTAWIPSDAPKGADEMDDSIGTQSDMASFAGGASGSDEDLLSSISSDVKRTVKAKDNSLLRELKDFKAPANEIELELTDMYQKMSIVQKPKDKTQPGTNGVK
jgi:hypothetical protein